MKSRKSMGFSMAPSNSQIPLAYALDIWDVVGQSDGNDGVATTQLLELFGGGETNAGQYTQSEINEKIAEAINTLKAAQEVIASAGSLVVNPNATSPNVFFNGSNDLPSSGVNESDYAVVLESDTNVSVFARYHYNGSAWVKDFELSSDKFTAAQMSMITSGDVDKALMTKLSNLPTQEGLTTLLAGKQDNLTFDSVPTSESPNPVTSGGVYTAIGNVNDKVSTLASSSNRALSESEINDKISSNTATYRGVYESVASLPASQSGLKEGDYAYVHDLASSESGNPSYDRYKYTEEKIITVGDDKYVRSADDDQAGNTYAYKYGWYKIGDATTKIYTESETPAANDKANANGRATTGEGELTITAVADGGWLFEYTLNNSSFTAAQWASLNSGINKNQADYVQSLIEKDLYAEADAKFDVTTEIVSGGTYSVDTAASQTMVVKATVTYDGDNVDCINVAANSDAPDGWTRTGKGVYTRSATSTGGSAASVAAQEFKYKPGGVYGDHECKKSSTAKSMTIKVPFYYGWSTQTSKANTTAAVAELTRVNANTGSGTFITQVPNDGTSRRFWIVAKNTASAKTSGASILAAVESNVSFTSPQSNSVTLSGYNVYISEQPYEYDALKAIDIVWSVPAAN